MSAIVDFVLLGLVVLDLAVLASGRVGSHIRACVLQGVALALLPVFWRQVPAGDGLVHVIAASLGTLLVKGGLVPFLLARASRVANVQRDVEPFISLHASVVVGAALVGFSFWLGSVLVLPRPAPSELVVPAAFATLFTGLLVLVSRRKAITQVVGYLLLENGVFVFGQALSGELPFVVELGILLDVLVAVFVMGIAIHHISQEFDHIDTERLSALKD